MPNVMKSFEVVAAIIRDGDGRFFCTQRGYGEWKGWYEFPGGKMEVGETAVEALCREIREELATEIRVGEWLTTVEYDYPGFHLTMHCFLCSFKLREESLELRDEGLGLREESLELRDEGLGLREESLELREEGLGLREESLELRDQNDNENSNPDSNSEQYRLLEHEDARWLLPSELDSVRWLPADEVVIGLLRG